MSSDSIPAITYQEPRLTGFSRYFTDDAYYAWDFASAKANADEMMMVALNAAGVGPAACYP